MENETSMDMTKRGKWTSASNAQADLLCEGRHLAQLGIADIASSAAEHGNQVHEALKKQDPAGLTTEQEESYEACNAITLKLIGQYYPDAAGIIAPPVRERRLWIKWADGLYHSGQADFAQIIGWRGLIVDYKSLRGDVLESPSNLQLRDLAVLLKQNVPELKEVGVAVVQPLVTHSPEICNYTEADLLRARDELYMRVYKSNQPNAKRTPGEVQCKWCRAKSNCAPYNQFAGKMVINEPSLLVDIPVANWTPSMRASFLERLPLAQKWLDDCKAEMKRLLKENPAAVPGYALSEGQKRSTIINAQNVFEAFSKAGGKLDDFMQTITVGKTLFKEAVKKTTGLKGKKLDEAVDGLIGENLKVTVTEPSIIKSK